MRWSFGPGIRGDVCNENENEIENGGRNSNREGERDVTLFEHRSERIGCRLDGRGLVGFG